MSSPRLYVVLVLTALLISCGGGTSHNAMAPAPVFTSTPPNTASQGVLYSYSITASDPAGGNVGFTLSAAPEGAMLSGNTLSWTPSGAESRIADSFTVTATSSEGGRATQSWSLTPAGTINGSWIDTRWTSKGSSDIPLDWTKARFAPQALVPQPDGTFVAIVGSGNSDGTFTIPNVPGGYYWLQAAPGPSLFWTSSSSIDLGRDTVGVPVGLIPNNEKTTFDFNINGLDPVETGDQFAFLTDWEVISSFLNIGFPIPSPVGSTSMTAT